MKKLIIIALISFSLPFGNTSNGGAFAQTMVNYGSLIYMANNDTIFVNGGVFNFKDTVPGGGPGTFRNSGQVYVTGDWTNSSGGPAFTSTNGNTTTNSTIDFHMVGGTQKIQGTSVTEFYKLDLEGTGTGAKSLTGIDAKIEEQLNLNDRELATGPNTAFVSNTSTTSVTRSTGYVSSGDLGSLARSTAGSQPYLFPVGASTRYRPVEITPDNASVNDYAVGMIAGDPSVNGFPVTQKEANISTVNQTFYYQIRRPTGSAPATITMFYDDIDGKFAGMGHWQNQPQWEDITAAPSAGNYGLARAMSKQGWDFSNPSPAFALIKLLNECGEMFVPTAFSPDNNGENDIELVYGKCIQKIYFAIYDRWGEKVFETTDPTKGWDGVYKGAEMNTGVFVYYLQATLTTGEEVTKKGNISLFR